MSYKLLRYLPKNHLSALVGNLLRIKLPSPLRRISVEIFVRMFRIDYATASKALHEYQSIGDFFVRDLQPGIRPVGHGLVSPVDGTLREIGTVSGDVISHIKGRSYKLGDFLGDAALSERYQGGTYINLYLSPPDYHHVHSPVEGTITSAILIPGKLWPVNDWALNSIENLFSINERLVTCIDCSEGLVTVVMVGATNVGKMTTTYTDLVSNRLSSRTKIERRTLSHPVKKGERLGTFHMGSTVVVFLEKGAVDLRHDGEERATLFGQSFDEILAR